MVKIFDMVNGVFETPGNPDASVSPTTGAPVAGSHLPEQPEPSLQEAPCGEDTRPEPELPPGLIDISIDSFIRRQ